LLVALHFIQSAVKMVSAAVKFVLDLSNACRYNGCMERNHPLTDYLNAAGESVTDFAQRVGVSRMQVYRLINGEGVSLDMIDRVSAATNGAVSAAAIVAARSTANEAAQ